MISISLSSFEAYFILFLAMSALNFCTVRSQYEDIVNINQPLVLHRPNWSQNYFGYSVAYIQGKTESSLFIGSPNETSLTKNSGVIWVCTVSTNDKNVGSLKCSVMEDLSNRYSPNNGGCRSESSYSFPEPQTVQWLGGSLGVTNDNELLACAPRTKKNGWRYGRQCSSETNVGGICYVTSRNGMNLLYTINPTDQFVVKYLGLDALQSADMGLSAHVLSTGEILLGAPSAKLRGAVLKCQGSMSNVGCEKLSRFNAFTPIQYGYAITSGRSTGEGSQYIAVANLRGANLLGEVFLYAGHQPHSQFGKVTGEHVGSQFGYSLETCDINGDGYDELLVGAPFQAVNKVETGCVFVYSVSNRQVRLKSKLCPQVSKLARFGSAIVRIGDLNNDGIMDFVVGAPYDDDAGALFLFYGNKHMSLKPSGNEKISGKSWKIPGLQLHGFGTALTIGDIDDNGVNDIIASSFEGFVVALRSRPVAHAKLQVTFHRVQRNSLKEEINFLLPNQDQFGARVCVKVGVSGKTTRKTLGLWIQLAVSPKSVTFTSSTFADEREIEVSMRTRYCEDILLTMNEDASQPQLPDENLVTLRTTVWYNKSGEVTGKPFLIEISHKTMSPMSLPKFREIDPAKLAPVSLSKSIAIAGDTCTEDDQGKPRCIPNLKLHVKVFYTNINEPKEGKLDDNQEIILGRLKTIRLSITLENSRDTAYDPTVVVKMEIGEMFLHEDVTVVWSTKPTSCSSQEGPLSERVTCSKPLHGGRSLQFEMKIDNLRSLKRNVSSSGDTKMSQIRFNISAYPEDKELSNYRVNNTQEISLLDNFNVSGSTSSQATDDINPDSSVVDFGQVIVIKNSGYSATGGSSVTVKIDVPTTIKTSEGRSKRIISVGDPSKEDVHCRYVDGEFYSVADSSYKNDTKGDEYAIKDVTQHIRDGIFEIVRDININKLGSFKSSQIICKTDIPSRGSQEINLLMYLHLPKQKSDLKGIKLRTDIAVVFNEAEIFKFDGSVSRSFQIPKGIPAWVYLVSAFGGLFLLLLATMGLTRLGFFKRAKKEELNLLKRQTVMELQESELSDLLRINSD